MAISSGVLLSIAIPTKNRQNYLQILVDELLTSSSQEFEIVVQDNSDTDSLRQWAEAKGDPRLKYSHHEAWISVIDNCDQALLNCSGDFICMLGDDDGILLDEALDCMAEARRDGVDAVMGPVLNYIWPGLDHRLISGYGGKLYIQPIKGKTISNDFHALGRNVVGRGGALGLGDMPCVYHGFISRLALTTLFNLSGSHFPGASPDMANAIGLCAVLKKMRRTPEVLVITGHSIRSAAGAGTQRKHHGPIAEQPHLPRDTSENWHPAVPFFWSGPTIYAQSLISALERTHNTALGVPRLACVYAACLIFHWEYRAAVFTAIQASNTSKAILYPQILYFTLMITLKRTKSLLINLTSRFGTKRAIARKADTIASAIHAARSLSNGL